MAQIVSYHCALSRGLAKFYQQLCFNHVPTPSAWNFCINASITVSNENATGSHCRELMVNRWVREQLHHSLCAGRLHVATKCEWLELLLIIKAYEHKRRKCAPQRSSFLFNFCTEFEQFSVHFRGGFSIIWKSRHDNKCNVFNNSYFLTRVAADF